MKWPTTTIAWSCRLFRIARDVQAVNPKSILGEAQAPSISIFKEHQMKPILALLFTLFMASSLPPPDATFRPWNGTPVKGDYTLLVTDVHDGDSFTGCLLV